MKAFAQVSIAQFCRTPWRVQGPKKLLLLMDYHGGTGYMEPHSVSVRTRVFPQTSIEYLATGKI